MSILVMQHVCSLDTASSASCTDQPAVHENLLPEGDEEVVWTAGEVAAGGELALDLVPAAAAAAPLAPAATSETP